MSVLARDWRPLAAWLAMFAGALVVSYDTWVSVRREGFGRNRFAMFWNTWQQLGIVVWAGGFALLAFFTQRRGWRFSIAIPGLYCALGLVILAWHLTFDGSLQTMTLPFLGLIALALVAWETRSSSLHATACIAYAIGWVWYWSFWEPWAVEADAAAAGEARGAALLLLAAAALGAITVRQALAPQPRSHASEERGGAVR